MVDMVVHRRDLRPTLVRTIGLLMTPRLDAVAEDIDLSAAQAADGEPAQLPQSATQPVTQPATQATAAQPAATQQASSQQAAPVQAGDD